MGQLRAVQRPQQVEQELLEAEPRVPAQAELPEQPGAPKGRQVLAVPLERLPTEMESTALQIAELA